MIGLLAILVSGLLGLAIFLVPAWRICGRVGFPPAVSLVILVPGFGYFVLLGILAFAEWPSAQSVER